MLTLGARITVCMAIFEGFKLVSHGDVTVKAGYCDVNQMVLGRPERAA